MCPKCVVYSVGSVMICRPCHGPFTEAVIRQALGLGVHEAAYVGLERNLEDDLGDLTPSHASLMGAGQDEESVWIVGRSNLEEP